MPGVEKKKKKKTPQNMCVLGWGEVGAWMETDLGTAWDLIFNDTSALLNRLKITEDENIRSERGNDETVKTITCSTYWIVLLRSFLPFLFRLKSTIRFRSTTCIHSATCTSKCKDV